MMPIKIDPPEGMKRSSRLTIEELVAVMQVMPKGIGVDEAVDIILNIVANNDLADDIVDIFTKLTLAIHQVGYQSDEYDMDDLVAQMKKGAN